VTKPNAVVMRGAVTDSDARLFYRGYYNQVLRPLFKSHAYVDVANPPGTWDPPTALTEFTRAYTAHKNINSALIPSDENAAPIDSYLRTHGVKPYTFPTTGQGATLTGLQNVISGYQCGTVYTPIYLEAQGAAALAIFLRAGKTPPSSLVNGTVEDTTEHVGVRSVLEPPEWVTPTNLASTVITDKFVPVHGPGGLCTGSYKADCRKYGIR
jgi:D-xylose transport system substrate-binding protein